MKLSVYAVRVAETREPVGIIAAKDPQHIASIVDELCPTQGMEYLPLGAGGIFVAETTKQWPDPREPDEMTDTPFSHVSEGWSGCVHKDDGWLPMPSSLEPTE
ncbi:MULTISPECIES: hypothetical protein [unclassified Brevundimonas]|uniref:hypothetical protein n=1 Tax=unclassified Brevundimonas TaxID=2622653 RepID=UPI0025BB71DE|nr:MULTISPECIES: hypothetical protein [unclassified Brevundimonas]